jgi:hypothetical protein
MSEEPIEHELLRQAVCVLGDCAFETTTEHFMENTRVRVTMHGEPDLLESCSLGVVYALGVLSFHDARPRGNSGIAFAEKDDWTVADMLRGLSFPGGRLYFYADYVRGRMMKTSVEVFPDGRIALETQNRGEAATRWIQKLQGKKMLALVEDEPGGEERTDE